MWLVGAALTLLLAPASQAPVWHRVSASRDLTGDSRAEALQVAAFGTRSDSLHIVFTIADGGRELLRQEWESTSYFFGYKEYEAPADIPTAERDSVMRAQLEGFFRPQAFEPFDPAAPEFSVENLREELVYCLQPVPQASALDSLATTYWAKLNERRPVVFAYSKGYEAGFWIAWSSEAHAFLILWSCC